MYLRLLGIGLAAAVFIGTAGCDESLSKLAGPTPSLEPTFGSIQREIFSTTDSSGRLACVTCHTGRNPFAPMNLGAATAYAQLVNVASVERPSLRRVNPGNPDASYLIHKLEGGPNILGARMPFGVGPFLTNGQILVIRRWITLGARND